MLAPGATYEGARDAWAPFDRLQAPDPIHRREVAELAARAAATGSPVYVVINNKAEGSAPRSAFRLAAEVVSRRSA